MRVQDGETREVETRLVMEAITQGMMQTVSEGIKSLRQRFICESFVSGFVYKLSYYAITYFSYSFPSGWVTVLFLHLFRKPLIIVGEALSTFFFGKFSHYDIVRIRNKYFFTDWP